MTRTLASRVCANQIANGESEIKAAKAAKEITKSGGSEAKAAGVGGRHRQT